MLFWVDFGLIFLWIWIQKQSETKKSLNQPAPDIYPKLLNHSWSIGSVQLMGESYSVGAKKACGDLCGITTFYHACHHATHYLHGIIYYCCRCWHNLFFFFSPTCFSCPTASIFVQRGLCLPSPWCSVAVSFWQRTQKIWLEGCTQSILPLGCPRSAVLDQHCFLFPLSCSRHRRYSNICTPLIQAICPAHYTWAFHVDTLQEFITGQLSVASDSEQDTYRCL